MRAAIFLLLTGCDSALIAYGFCNHSLHLPIEIGSKIPSVPKIGSPPLLVRIESSDLVDQDHEGFSFFSGESCEALGHEVEAFDPDTGSLVAWVGARDGEPLSLAFGGEIDSPPSDPFVRYRAVWHLSNAEVVDSVNGLEGRLVQAMRTAGVAGRGIELGSQGLIDFGDPGDPDLDFGIEDSFSFSLWALKIEKTGTFQQVLQKGGTNQSIQGYAIEIDEDGDRIYACLSGGGYTCDARTESATIADDVWVHLAAVVDREAEELRFYLNGDEKQSEGIDDIDPDHEAGNERPLQAGNSAYPFRGRVDEIRLIDVALPPEWIKFEYENQQPGKMLDVGAVERAP